MMKKLIPLLLLILIIGCDESFSPKGEYQERYALFGIMRADTNYQVVTLYQSYNVPGLDPFENKLYPFIDGAYVRIWKNPDEVFVLSDSTIPASNLARYPDSAKFYYSDKLTPEKRDVIQIEALLPNGRRLKAETTVPKDITTDYSVTDRIIPVKGRSTIRIGWVPNEPNIIYSPKIVLVYKTEENGQLVLHNKEIPQKYFNIDGKEEPFFPQPTNERYIELDKIALDRALTEISEGDPDKSKYRIFTLITKIYVFDRNLSAFYSSSNKFGDQYSIRVDESDFTNVDGGFGVFGSYSEKSIVQFFDQDYIQSFGYRLEVKP